MGLTYGTTIVTRLFISLYFAVTLGLIFIGWSSDKVWQLVQSSTDTDIESLAKLSKTLPLLLTNERTTPQQLSAKFGFAVTVMPLDTVVIQAQQLSTLHNGEPFLIYNDNNQLSIMLMMPSGNALLYIGPINLQNNTNNQLKNLVLLASYLLLAGIIALWTYPLWRDLNRLQKSAIRFGKGFFDDEIGVKKRSVVWPLANTFSNMATQISRLIDEQKQMTNAVSHDLRTPLSRLKFSLAMLDGDKEQLEDMKQDVAELENLVDEILSYGRLESEQQQLNLHHVNLAELLQNQVEKLQRNAPQKITLTTPTTITCLCDGHLIERATQNLITNALRYGNSRVEVNVEQSSHYYFIHVDDDGQGIAQQDHSKIFKAFTRLEKSRNKAKGGFGLGLAIVQRIMQWHQGQCNVSSSSLGGARFTLRLPKSH